MVYTKKMPLIGLSDLAIYRREKEGSLTFEAPLNPRIRCSLLSTMGIPDWQQRTLYCCYSRTPVLSLSPLIGTLSETGLVLYLPLDNDSQDMSGSGNHGVPTSTLIVPGKIGQAYDFNGIDSTVITPLISIRKNTGNVGYLLHIPALMAEDRYGLRMMADLTAHF